MPKCGVCKKEYELRNLLVCGSTLGTYLGNNTYDASTSETIYECKRCAVEYLARQFPDSDIRITI